MNFSHAIKPDIKHRLEFESLDKFHRKKSDGNSSARSRTNSSA